MCGGGCNHGLVCGKSVDFFMFADEKEMQLVKKAKEVF